MMASIATAVLPVWRSPMISSRWPRPIGISVSMALRPVCTGSCTDLRGIMPGALTSTRRRSAAPLISPLPSMGLPSGSTTRPSRALPTGTSTMAPVRLTVSPSLMVLSLPKITQPTLSVSRLRAMPLMPPGTPTISPAWTLSRPWTRAMPSPTLSTSPTSLTCASAQKFWISRLRMAEISAGWISILVSFHGRTQAVELGAKRRVDHARADLDDEAAEQGGVDFGMKTGFLAQGGLERGFEFGDFRITERTGGGDFCLGLAPRFGDQTLLSGDDLGQHN